MLWEFLNQLLLDNSGFFLDLSVVQLFLDSERILWLLRFCCSKAPLLIPVKLLPRVRIN